jgi:RNA polymerase sigma factor (sigma-70 family)
VHDTGATDIPVLSVGDTLWAEKRRAEIEGFYVQHQRWVLTVLVAFGVEIHQAEDAMQEALEKAWMQSGKTIENLPSWVVTVSLNIARGKARQRKQQLEVLVQEPLEMSGQCVQDPGEAAWELREAALNDARRLPSDQRAAVALKIDGWDQAEIAQKLGKSPQQVVGLMYRGFQTLRKMRRAREQQDAALESDNRVTHAPRQRGRTAAGGRAVDNSMDGKV